MLANQPHESGACSQLLEETQSTVLYIKDRLNNYRNSFAFVSNLFVLVLGLCVFSLMNNKKAEYQLISVLVIIVGLCCSFFFLFQIN